MNFDSFGDWVIFTWPNLDNRVRICRTQCHISCQPIFVIFHKIIHSWQILASQKVNAHFVITVLAYHLIEVILIKQIQFVLAEHLLYNIIPIFGIFVLVFLLINQLFIQFLKESFLQVLLKLTHFFFRLLLIFFQGFRFCFNFLFFVCICDP